MGSSDRTITYEVEVKIQSFVPVEGGFATVRAFTVRASFADDPIPFKATIDVEIDTTPGEPVRAYARRVVIETESEGGVSSTVLRALPIRDVVGYGCLNTLHRVHVTPSGEAKLVPVPEGEASAEITGVIQRLVGYARFRVPLAQARASAPAPTVESEDS